MAHDIHEVIRDDLLFSRRFKTAEPPSPEAAMDPRGSLAEWRRAATAFLLAARVSMTGDKTTVSAALFDLNSGQSILDRYYRQDSAFWRSLAHHIADDVLRQLTGRSGVARTRIAFVNDVTGKKEVYVVDYDGAALRRLTHDGSISLLPRWSPDRKRLIYTSYKRVNPDLFEIDMERGTQRVFLEQQGLNVAGGFSPDGSKLVLIQSRQKSPNVYLMDVNTRSPQRITDHFGVDSSPTFSPDSKQVAFVSDRSGNPQIHILELASRRVRRLTVLNWCDSPSWSPTGEWIAFSGRAHPKDSMDIFLVDVTGSHVRQLTHGEGSNEDPSWSPDGRSLVFTTTRNKRRELFVMDPDGSAPRPVGDIPGNSFTPHWSP